MQSPAGANGVDKLEVPLDYLIGPRRPVNVMTQGDAPGALGGGSNPGAEGGFSIYPPMTDTLVPLPFPTPAVMDLVRRLRTQSNTFVYRYQSTDSQLPLGATDNAATAKAAGFVEEGAAGQEIKPAWKTARAPVVKALAFAEVTEEQIEDGEDVDTLISEQLQLELRNTVERDLMLGSGNNERMEGLLVGLGSGQTTAMPAGSSTKPIWGFDYISQAIFQIVKDLWFMPDAVVMDPLAWSALSTARTSQGQLQFMDPTEAAQMRVLGLPVILSPYTAHTNPHQTVAVGAWARGAALVDRRDVTLSRTDSHSTRFVEDVVTIKGSVRIANARFYDKAFRTITAFDGRKAG